MGQLPAPLQLPLVIFQLTKLLIFTFYMVHVCACIYWFVKDISSSEAEMIDFFAGQKLDDETASKYVLSAYFISSVFTTVGFGDVAAMNEAEQIFSMVIMYMGTFVFGTLLSEVESAVEAARHMVRAKSRVKQQTQEFLRSKGINRQFVEKILSWIDFNFAAQHDHMLHLDCFAQIPKTFRLELLGTLHDRRLRGHPVFAHLVGPNADGFLDELWGCMHAAAFADGDIIASNFVLSSRMHNEPDRSYLIDTGSADLYVQGRKVVELQCGDFIGELCCLGETSWCTDIELPLSFVATSNVICLCLAKADLDDVLTFYPELRCELFEHTEHVRRNRLHSAAADQQAAELSGAAESAADEAAGEKDALTVAQGLASRCTGAWVARRSWRVFPQPAIEASDELPAPSSPPHLTPDTASLCICPLSRDVCSRTETHLPASALNAPSPVSAGAHRLAPCWCLSLKSLVCRARTIPWTPYPA